MAENKKSTPTSAQKKPVTRASLTDDQRKLQQALSKIKRLNLKLSKVKAVSVNMGTIATKTNEVSSRQVEAWSKKINAILNGEQ